MEKWLIERGGEKFELNVASYSALFVNSTTNEEYVIRPILNYFKTKNSLKDVIIKDILQDFEEITPHSYFSIELSNYLLEDEIQLGSKSMLKSYIKNEMLNYLETDSYLFTINTLIKDIVKEAVEDLPLKVKDIDIDTILKSISFGDDFLEKSVEIRKEIIQTQKFIPLINEYFKKRYNKSLLVVYKFPEMNLSPKEQLILKDILIELGNETHTIVVTSSRLFLSNKYEGNNYFNKGNQLFTEELLNNLEWDCPTTYSKEELKESLMYIIANFIDRFELNPTISNYKNADIILFKSVDIYVLVYILNKLKLKFTLDIQKHIIEKPVAKYILDIYEKI
jgi:hypothetical protein